MNIDLFLSSTEIQKEKLNDRIAVIIDVLRASTSIITALANGCKSVIPVSEVEQARKMASKFSDQSVLLGGERNEMIIPGFDLSNSPLEYKVEIVKNKWIIFTSTNGARLFEYSQFANKTVIGGFVNVTVLSQFIINNRKDIAILCAGKNNQFGLEDAVCGGMLVDKIINKITDSLILNDSAMAAHILYQNYQQNLIDMLYRTSHGRRLIEIGQEKDFAKCAAVDSIEIIPVLNGEELIPLT